MKKFMLSAICAILLFTSSFSQATTFAGCIVADTIVFVKVDGYERFAGQPLITNRKVKHTIVVSDSIDASPSMKQSPGSVWNIFYGSLFHKNKTECAVIFKEENVNEDCLAEDIVDLFTGSSRSPKGCSFFI